MNTKVPTAKPKRTRYTVYQALSKAGLDSKLHRHLTTPKVAKAMADAAKRVIKKAERATRKQMRKDYDDRLAKALNNGE